VPSLGGGGAERQLTYLARAFVEMGWDVHVAIVQGGPNLTRLEATGATIHRLHAVRNYDPQILYQLLGTIRRIKPDVAQCWLLQMEVMGGLASLLSGTPWVFCERASEEAYPSSLKMWLRVRIGRLATAIVSNSQTGDRYWAARTREGVKRRVIPNCVPFAEIAATPPASLAEIGVTTEDRVLLIAGRMEPQKNFETFVRALRFVVASRPVQAVLCGDGSLRGRVEKLVEENGLGNRVHIAGYVSNLWSVMKRADVTVSVSWFEGSPNVVLEAMACGCPLVVSDIPTHREILDEDAAVFVDPAEPKRVAEGIIRSLSDPERAKQRARTAQDRVQRYSPSTVANEYADLYRELAWRPARERIEESEGRRPSE
jgi:glycosyltransferase involved in cell wall biosynthesis